MNETIGFFSSDARSLYKEDIYRALALPKKSILHFRYDKKYVDEDVKAKITNFIGCDGIIFYLTGNDLSKREEERNISTFSIRKVKIKDIERSENTELIHFYLELGDFFDCTLTKYDVDKFVSKISFSVGIKHKWFNRVEAIKNNFEKILFINCDIVDKNSKVLDPEYSELNHFSTYQIKDESKYSLRCSYYDTHDTQQGESFLSFSDSDHISVSHKDQSRIGAIRDDREYEINTGAIMQSSVPGEIRLSPQGPTQNNLKCEVVLLFEIKKNKSKTIIFGVLSGLLFLSVLFGQLISNLMSKNPAPSMTMIFLTIFGIAILGGFSAASLFHFFNKK